MDLIDSKFADLKLEDGKLKLEIGLIEALRALAKSTDNGLDDKLVDLVEAALAKKA